MGRKGARQQFSWTSRDTFDLFCWTLTVSVSPDFPLGISVVTTTQVSGEWWGLGAGQWRSLLAGMWGDLVGDLASPRAPGLLSLPGVEECQRETVRRRLLKPLCSLPQTSLGRKEDLGGSGIVCRTVSVAADMCQQMNKQQLISFFFFNNKDKM